MKYIYTLLTICFASWHMTHFAMNTNWNTKSSILQFQESIELEKKPYQQALYLDNGIPGNHVAQLFMTDHFESDVANKPLYKASTHFQNCSFNDRKAIINHASEDAQLLFRTLQSPLELQDHVIRDIFTANNQTNNEAVIKFYQLPLKDAYFLLSLCNQYAKKTDNKIDIGSFFVLNNKKERQETINMFNTISKNINEYGINSPEQYFFIKSLPKQIKNNELFSTLTCIPKLNYDFKKSCEAIEEFKLNIERHKRSYFYYSLGCFGVELIPFLFPSSTTGEIVNLLGAGGIACLLYAQLKFSTKKQYTNYINLVNEHNMQVIIYKEFGSAKKLSDM